MRSVLVLLVSCLLPSLTAAEGLWYANQGSRVYSEQRVPTTWDAAQGTNIRWKTALPNWSNGSPLLVDGRIYVCSEPLAYAPILSCIDAESGVELWRRELDPVAAFPRGEQAELRELATWGWDWQRAMITLWNEVKAWATEHPDQVDSKSGKLAAGIEAAFAERFGERLAALGVRYEGFKSGAGGFQTFFPFAAKDNEQAQRVERLQKLGLAWEHWSWFGTWTGSTFATPASDGERIFTTTGQNLYSCHDRDGELLWQQRFDWPDRRGAAQQLPAEQHERVSKDGRICWPFNTQGLVATSPICVDGCFVTMNAAMIRCFDAASGTLRWSLPMRGGIGQNCATPGAMVLGSETFLIVPSGEGRVGPDGDDIIRLRDGRICGLVPGGSSAKMAIAGPIISGEVVYTYGGDWRDRSILAYRLSHDGRVTVRCEELWSIKQKAVRGMGLWRACVHGGRLLHGSVMLDATSGALVADRLPDARHRYCWWSGMIVGPHHLGIDHSGGSFVFRDLTSGKQVGAASLPVNPPEARDEVRIATQERGTDWSVLGAATPVAWKNRLYVRSYDYLWCIGER